MKGFIKDYRQELKSDIWLMPPLYHRVWQYLKYMVNHDNRKVPMKDGTFFTVQKGQHLTSVRSIAQGVGYYEGMKWKEPNPKTISTILSWLEKQQMIQVERGKGNRQYTLITLLKWEIYQSKNNEGNSKETVDGEGQKQFADINKNDKELLKNDKNNSTTSTRESDAIRFYESNIGMASPFEQDSILNWIKDTNELLVIEAIKRSILRGKPSWGYAQRILRDWNRKNIKTIDQAKAEDVEFENQKSSRRFYGPSQKKEVLPKWYEEEKKNRQAQQLQPKINEKSKEDTEKKRAELQAFINNYKRTQGG